MDLVIENLYISSFKEVEDKELLEKHKITHILSCCPMNGPLNGFEHKVIPIYDTEKDDISKYFEESVEFINKGLEKGAVLVHCLAGVSRSATIILYFLQKQKKMSYKESYLFLKEKRSIIEPNDGFKRQLMKFSPSSVDIIRKKVRCKICRFELFDISETIQHEMGKNRKKFIKKNEKLQDKLVCNKLFLDRLDWMGELTELEGTIYCPNSKCKTKVGGYRWDGEQCSCGVWISPSIHILKSKVDV